MRKDITSVFLVSVFFGGLVTLVVLSGQNQNLNNKAAVSNGLATISLTPLTSNHYPGEVFPVIVKFNTAGAKISSVTFRLTYLYSGITPPLDVVDSSGNQSNQVFPDSGLTTSGDWSFPVRSVTRSNGLVTIDVAAVDTNINGFSSTSDTNLVTIYLKAASGITGSPLPFTLAFNSSVSQIMTKANPPVDILKVPASATYTITPDIVPPSAISDLKSTNISTNSVALSWTAPADTGPSINVSSYQVRYSTSPITSANWGSALIVANPPVPLAPGSSQTMNVGGLTANTTYYFGVKSTDSVGNVSNLSNVISVLTLTTCSHNSPTLNLVPQTQTGQVGQQLTYQLNLINTNTGGCSNETYSFSVTGLTGWTIGIPHSLSIPNGGGGSVNIAITPSNTTVNGAYNFAVNVTNSVGGASAVSGSYVVNSALTMNFKIKLQGVNSSDTNYSNALVAFKVGPGLTPVYVQIVNITPDTNGVYSGTVSGINPGTYDIYIKEATHLQKKFAAITLSSGANTEDFTGVPMMAGDFNDDNIIDIGDMASILSAYTSLTVPVTSANKIYDVNGDGVISINDVALGLSNYTALQINGD